MLHQAVMKRIFPLVRRRHALSSRGAIELEMVFDPSNSSPLECKFIFLMQFVYIIIIV